MRVLITRHVFAQAVDLLRPHVELDYRDEASGLDAASLAARLRGVDAVICQLTDRMTAEVIGAEPNLRIIANVAVGYDNIDVAAATAAGVMVTNTPGVLTESTADFAFGLLLAGARRISEAERFLRAGHWREWQVDLLSGQDVHGATLGIVGMGRIGQAMARRAKGFGMRLLASTRTPLDHELEKELGVARVGLPELLAESDFVSLHVPLRDETRHLIGAAELAQMRPNALLVNTARGPVVDEAALAEALASGRIAGAALDVFEREPTVHPKLLELDNALLVPHIASSSVQTRTRMCCMAAENVLALVRGERPPNLVG